MKILVTGNRGRTGTALVRDLTQACVRGLRCALDGCCVGVASADISTSGPTRRAWVARLHLGWSPVHSWRSFQRARIGR